MSIKRSDIYVRCVPLEWDIKDDGTGNVFDYQVPIRVEVYVRDDTAAAERREPLQLIEIQKFLVDLFATNKYALQDDGISHIIIQNTQTRPVVDNTQLGLGNWYELFITVLLVYRLKYDIVAV